MTIQKKIAAFATAFVLIIFFAPRVYANSAEPPSFVIYSPNAPDDTEIFILHAFAANILSMVLGGFMLIFLPY